MRLRFLLLLAALLPACSQQSAGPTSPTATSSVNAQAGMPAFRVSPIAQDAIKWITPLGNLNPPAHAIPTDHIYFYFADPDTRDSIVDRRVEFRAPGDGVVTTVLGGVGQESKIFVRQTSTFTYYLDHLILSSALERGSPITAGQVLGTTGNAYGIDLGVINDGVTLNFVMPARYVPDTLHADAPLKYFDEPLRSQLYARVQRLGSELDGRIDYDVAGRLAGNWFIGGQTPAVSFAYDTYDPARVVLATATGTLQGVFGIAASDPLPRDVSRQSGRVLYRLTRTITGPPRVATPGLAGYMLVEMTDDMHIRMQTFTAETIPADFTGSAGMFTR